MRFESYMEVLCSNGLNLYMKVFMGDNGLEIIWEYMYILKIESPHLDALLSFLLLSRFSSRSEAFQVSYSGGNQKKV